MATSHVEMFHQIKSELFKDHEAAVGRRVDRNEWEKVFPHPLEDSVILSLSGDGGVFQSFGCSEEDVD